MKAAKTVILKIEDLSHDGRGVGALPSASGRGSVVFVPGALPGQLVQARVRAAKANYLLAELEHVLEGEALFGSPICPHWEECGGCSLQRMDYGAQLQWKEKLVFRTLARIGKLDPEDLQNAWGQLYPSPDLLAFRNKARLAFCLDSEACLPGYYKRQSHKVLPIEKCALLPDSAHRLLDAWRRNAVRPLSPSSSNLLKSLTFRSASLSPGSATAWHVLLKCGRATKAMQDKIKDLAVSIMSDCPGLSTFTTEFLTDPGSGPKPRKEIFTFSSQALLPDSPDLYMPLGGRFFAIKPESFFQVNTGASEILAQVVREMDESTGGNLLDLYCGVGAPGQLLNSGHQQCMGIEQDIQAIAQARKNASRHLETWEYKAGDCGAILGNLPRHRWDTVLADPPRAGLDKSVRAAILEMQPQHIIYISCNPASMARDSSVLKNDYKLKKLAGVDMFPHTPHVECVTLWERR